MTALSGTNPARGVRYVFTLAAHDDTYALYDVAVSVADRTGAAQVRIEGGACKLEGEARDVEPAHAAQLVALAKTIARRDDTVPWPRRVERWRSPGVR
jgi:hypothetical protein